MVDQCSSRGRFPRLPLAFHGVDDDWRLRVDLRDPGHVSGLMDRLEARELEHDLSTAFADRVIVSRNGTTVFLYAGAREQIDAAAQVVKRLGDKYGWRLDTELRRWHPIAEEWEDPDQPLPESEAARAAERAELMATERRESEESGEAQFEVRIDLPSRHDSVELAKRLDSEGVPTVRRWKYVLVGAADEQSARALADRIREEAPPGSKVAVEGTWQEAYDERPPNAFAVFGGLGG